MGLRNADKKVLLFAQAIYRHHQDDEGSGLNWSVNNFRKLQNNSNIIEKVYFSLFHLIFETEYYIKRKSFFLKQPNSGEKIENFNIGCKTM